MKLSQYAKREGIQYRTAWNRLKKGKIDGAYLDESGHIVVPDPQSLLVPKAVIYARVNTNDQKTDLERQAARMVEFANAQGLSVVGVVTEVASGVNDNRPRLTKLLQRDDWGTLVVEREDRLARVGFEWFRVMLAAQGKRIIVANEADEDVDDFTSDLDSLIYALAVRAHGLRSARRRTDAALAAFEAD